MKFEDRNEAESTSNSAQGEERRQCITENQQGKLKPGPHKTKKLAVRLLQTDYPAGCQVKKTWMTLKQINRGRSARLLTTYLEKRGGKEEGEAATSTFKA